MKKVMLTVGAMMLEGFIFAQTGTAPTQTTPVAKPTQKVEIKKADTNKTKKVEVKKVDAKSDTTKTKKAVEKSKAIK